MKTGRSEKLDRTGPETGRPAGPVPTLKSVSCLLFERSFQWKHLQVDIISYEMLQKLLISKIKIKEVNADR